MDATRRRQTLGRHASAALPWIWKALARRDESHADFARNLGLSNATAARLLYGDLRPDVTNARLCLELYGAPLLLWDRPVPANWRPHEYPDLRRRARVQQATGTDG